MLQNSIYYDDNEFHLQPNKVRTSFGRLSDASVIRGRNSYASSEQSQVSTANTENLVPNRAEIIEYSKYTKRPKPRKKFPIHSSLTLQVLLLLLSFCYWCTSLLTIICWLGFVHESFYIKLLMGFDIGSTVDLSLVAGFFGTASSFGMFFFAVKPLSTRKSPAGEEQLETLTILLIFSIGLSLSSLLFATRLMKQFETGESGDRSFSKRLGAAQNDYFEEFGRSSNNRFWDVVQFQLGCCGIDNINDWKQSPFRYRNRKAFPITCCQQLPNFFDGPASFVGQVYENPYFKNTYYRTISESLNSTCYRQQTLVNTKGCYNPLVQFYSFLTELFQMLDLVMFILSSLTVILMPVSV